MAGTELSGLRVLVIDDYEDAADCMAWVFADVGAQVRIARDAVHVGELLQEFDPTLVLLDLALPMVDGFEACRIIRQTKGATPFIAAVTGWGGDEQTASCLEAGFDVHVTKPACGDLLIELGIQALRKGVGARQ